MQWGVKRIIDSEKCSEIPESGDGYESLENRRISFINKSRVRRLVGKKRLGLAWLVLDPVATSLIYLFVFIVIRANPNPETIFIGIALFRIMQSTFLGGTAFLNDFSGGLKAERVSSKTISRAIIRFRFLDSFLQSLGVGVVLLFFFDSEIIAVIYFLFIAQVMGFLFEGFGVSFFLLVKRIPDLSNLFRYAFQLLFFASPCLYPMSKAEGLHYLANEYNPFSYFVESVRLVFELDSVFESLNMRIFVLLFVPLLAISAWGYRRIDRIRWEVSSWGA